MDASQGVIWTHLGVYMDASRGVILTLLPLYVTIVNEQIEYKF